MKRIILAIIVLISIASFYNIIPSADLVKIYGILALIPVAFVLVRKSLFFSLLAWFILVMLKDFGNIPIPILPDMPPLRLLWLAILMIFFFEVIMRERKIAPGGMKFELVMIIFCVYIIFSMLISGTIYEGGHGLKMGYLLSGFALPFSVYFLAKNLISDNGHIRKAFLFFCIIGLYLGITGIFEHYRLDHLVFPRYIMRPGGLHFGQARGPFMNANVNGLTLGMIFFMSFFLYQRENNKNIKVFIVIAILFVLTTLFFTYNRATWIAFLFAVLFMPIFFPNIRKKLILFFLLVGFVVFSLFSFFPHQKESIMSKGEELEHAGLAHLDTGKALLHRLTEKRSWASRIAVLKASLQMFLDKPILGFGYLSFKRDSIEYISNIEGVYKIWDPTKKALSVHNTLAQLLVELGLVGFSLFIIILFYPLIIAIKLYRISSINDPFARDLSAIFFAVFVFYLIGMQAMVFHFSLFINAIYYFIIGIVDGLYRRHTNDSLDRQKNYLLSK